MSGKRLLALDVGTTSVRALVVTPDGVVLGRAKEVLEIDFPRPGWVEQDPEAMWARAVDVMRAALAAARTRAEDLAGLGLVSQRGTSLAWDARDGRPLAPAIGWQDRRTDARVAELNRQGVPINALASATKLQWLVEECPAVRRLADTGHLRLGTLDAWLGVRLSGGGHAVTDPGQAGATALYGYEKEKFSERSAAFFGLDPAWLPEVVPTSAVVGETPADLLGAAVPLAARAGDQQAAAFAQGAVSPGLAKLTLGTSAMIDLCTGEAPVVDLPGFYPLPLFTLADRTRAFCLEGSVITAAAAVDWLVDLGILESAAGLDALAGSVPDAAGVCFVPALQGLGSPYLDGEARGLLIGLTRGTTRAHLARATLEGVAHRCVDVVDGLAAYFADVGTQPAAGTPLAVGTQPAVGTPLAVDGGLAKSNLLVQRLADLLGRPVVRAAETETTALGAALLAGLATGVYAHIAEALSARRPGTRFEPMSTSESRLTARHTWTQAIQRTRTPSRTAPPIPDQPRDASADA